MKKLILILLAACLSNAYSQWTQCTTGLMGGPVKSVYASGDRVIIGTKRGIYYSTKECSPWSQAQCEDMEMFVNADVYDFVKRDGNLFAATEEGVLFSTDNGSYWFKTNLNAITISTIACDSEYIYAASTSYGVFRSRNGASWSKIEFNNPKIQSTKIAASDSYVFAGTSEGLYISSDHGETWTLKIIEEADYQYVFHLRAVGNFIYLKIGSCLLASSDAGETWAKVDIKVDKSFVNNYAANNRYAFAATGGGVYRSSDGISNWEKASHGLYQNFVYSITAIDDLIIAATADGPFVSTDDGDSWTRKAEGLYNIDFCSLYSDDEIVCAGSFYSGMYYSEDNGYTWKNSSIDVNFTNPLKRLGNYIFAGANYSVYRWDMEDKTWAKKDSGLKYVNAIELDVEGNSLYAVNYSEVFQSTNYGDSWIRIKTPAPIGCFGVENGQLFVGSSNSSKLYVSKNGGVDWTSIPIDSGKYFHSIFALTLYKDRIFVSAGGGLLVSSDEGETWVKSNTAMSAYCVKRFVFDSEYLFAITDGGLYYTSDLGDTWKSLSSTLPTKELSYISVNSERIFIIAPKLGMFSGNRADLGVKDAQETSLSSPMQVYPNPATEFITVSASIPSSLGYETAYIFDMLGAPVKSFKVASGSLFNRISITDLPAGEYYLQIGGSRATFIRE